MVGRLDMASNFCAVEVQFPNIRYWPITAAHEQPLSADSVEKVGYPKLPGHCLVRTPFLQAAA